MPRKNDSLAEHSRIENVETGRCNVSPEFERLLGYEPGEIRRHIDTWEENAHPDDLVTSLAAMKARQTGGAAEYTIEYRLRTKGGEWSWFPDRGNVVERDDEGRALRMVGLIQDITEHKHTSRSRSRRSSWSTH